MDDHKSCLQEFLSQTESPNPIVLHDAYDIEEITWMCYRLRKSEQFGSDNRLYLQYSSREMFQQKKQELDWTPVINTKKVVFTFSDSENGGEEKNKRTGYTFKKEYKRKKRKRESWNKNKKKRN